MQSIHLFCEGKCVTCNYTFKWSNAQQQENNRYDISNMVYTASSICGIRFEALKDCVEQEVLVGLPTIGFFILQLKLQLEKCNLCLMH